jgi:nitrobindin-like protein
VFDTVDLRSGAPLHDALLALLPLVGVWAGGGVGVVESTGAQFRFGQRAVFAHDGRPFLAYDSRAWLVDDAGAVLRLAWRESGFWRPGANADDIEVVLASNTGQSLLYTGTAGDAQWEITTQHAAPTPTAKRVDAERRLYAIRGDELLYVSELAPAGESLAPHLNARLQRAIQTAGSG